MPVAKQRIKRLSTLYRILELFHDKDMYIKQEDLLDELNDRVDYPVCKSSMEKDLRVLRVDFDIETTIGRKHNSHGIKLLHKVDFPMLMYSYLGLE